MAKSRSGKTNTGPFGKLSDIAGPPDSLSFAKELHWGEPGADLRHRKPPEIASDVAIGYISGRPAALFATDKRRQLSDIVPEIARLAYHSSIEWGLLANATEAIVFNAQRVRDQQWFTFPQANWRTSSAADIIASLTPDSIREGRVDDLAFASDVVDQPLAAVDDVLVETLDHWRDEAMRYSADTEQIDEKLQTLFSQLFVLRCIEDRKLSDATPSLESIILPTNRDIAKRLDSIFDSAKTFIQSELFAERPYREIPSDIVKGVIKDLYTPQSIPIKNFRYNFAWIDAGILGWAYQKYLSNVLSPTRADAQQFLFSQPKREVRRISVQKAGGVYYTPEFIVRYLTHKCVDAFFERIAASGSIVEDEMRLPIIADPACGSGSFLVAAVDVLLDRLKQINPRKQWGQRLIKDGCVIGIDIDVRAVTLARLAVWLRLAEEPKPLPLPRLADNIRQGDSLRDETWKGLPAQVDLLLGNPPFVAHLPPADRDRLAARFPTARGRSDLAYYFLELSVHKLAPGGFFGLVFPNRLFSSRDASELRQFLTNECCLLSVVDFGSNEVFVGTTSYIALLHGAKRLEGDVAKPLRFIRVRHVPARFPAWIIESAERQRGYVSNDFVVSYDVGSPSGPARWLFLSPSEKQFRMQLEQESTLLGDIAELPQGIKTAANDVFVVALSSPPVGERVNVLNGFGDSAWIETRFLHKVVFGADIQRYHVIDARRFLIYPYEEGRHVTPAEMKRMAPATLEYFERYRELLERRSSTSTRGKGWYELAEKRDERWLNQKKLLIRELAPEPAFALDQEGTTYLIGGTAVVVAEEHLLLPLLAYLNSSIVRVFLAQRTPEFKSAFQKFEPDALSSVPVPQQLLSDRELQENLSSLVQRMLSAVQVGADADATQLDASIDTLLRDTLQVDLPGV
jgi:hypothetical protein